MTRLWHILDRMFGIDLRSLAALRVGLGLLLLVDLAIRAGDLEAHYGDAGVVPRAVLADRILAKGYWSLHMLGGSAAFEACLFVLAALAAVGLTLGLYSRLAAGISWLLLVSLHARNPMINNGGDVLLRSLLFWAMFLPLDARWAVWRRAGQRVVPVRVLSIASAAILAQVALMYACSGYYKLYGGWQSLDVLERILRSDCYAKPWAAALLEYPRLLALLGRVVLWSELVLPWLVFSPIGTRSLRLIAITWFAVLHLGIELALNVGLFSYVCWLALVLFLPSVCWDWLRIPAQTAAPTNVQDEVSTRSLGRRFKRVCCGALPAVMLAYVLLWNLSRLPQSWTAGLMPRGWERVAIATGLWQKWNLFQNPMDDDGWYVVVAHLDDGRDIDLLRDGAPADWDSYRKPRSISSRFPNHRWRKYYRNILAESAARYREPLCRYLAASWQRQHPQDGRIVSVELQYMQEMGEGPDEDDRFQQRFLQTVTFPTAPQDVSVRH